MMCPQGRAAVAAELTEKKIKKNYILNYYSNFDVKVVSGTKLFLKSHLYTILVNSGRMTLKQYQINTHCYFIKLNPKRKDPF